MISLPQITEKSFQEQVMQHGCILLCAGEKLYAFCKQYERFLNKIYFIADNFYLKTSCVINGQRISVKSVGEAVEDPRYGEAVKVITSLKYADDIIKQLEEKGGKAEKGLFVVPEMNIVEDEELKRHDNELLKDLMGNTKTEHIPRKIHYFWVGPNEMPDQFKKNIESWHKFLPDYDFCLWNEDNYDFSSLPYMKEAYDEGKWGFVPDYARLDVLWKYGGIYLDTDVQIVRPLDPLLKFDFFCGFEKGNQGYKAALGLGFGAKQGHYLIKKMKDQYKNLHFKNSDGSFNLKASPSYQSEILARSGFAMNGRTQLINHNVILSTEYLAPFDFYGKGKITSRTFSIHQYAATWINEESLEDRNKVIKSIDFLKTRMEINASERKL